MPIDRFCGHTNTVPILHGKHLTEGAPLQFILFSHFSNLFLSVEAVAGRTVRRDGVGGRGSARTRLAEVPLMLKAEKQSSIGTGIWREAGGGQAATLW